MRDKFFNGLLLFQMTIFLLLLELLSFYIFVSIPSFQNVKDMLNHNVFRLTDNFLNERETELYNNKIGLSMLKQFNREIKSNDHFKYYEMISQTVYVPYFDNNEIFIEGYETGRPHPTANIRHNGQAEKFCAVKAFHLSENVFRDFNIQIEIGSVPKRDSYTYVKGNVIPILLGNAYKPVYKIGDSIDVYIISDFFKCEVAGFLEKGSNITINESYMHFLDRYMVLPSFGIEELPQTKDEKYMQFARYLQKNCGIIVSDYDAQKITNEISTITKNVGLDDNSYVLIGQKFANTLFDLTTDKIMILLSCLFIGMSLLLIMSLYAIVKDFIENNLHFLGVHLMCGATIYDLYKIILQRFLSIATVTLVISLIILKAVFNIMSAQAVFITVGASLILIIGTTAYSFNKNITVCNLLRRSE